VTDENREMRDKVKRIELTASAGLINQPDDSRKCAKHLKGVLDTISGILDGTIQEGVKK
jgi:hypothetical protein